MKFEKNSAFSFPFSTRYYLTHPWTWFKDLYTGLKNARMRVKYGFCWSDIWNYYDWYLRTTPQMLRHLGLHSSGYPGIAPFDEPGKWSSWLLWAADELEACREEVFEKRNEYYEEYMKQFENWEPNRKVSELDKQYFARERELYDEMNARRKRVMGLVNEYFPMLWD